MSAGNIVITQCPEHEGTFTKESKDEAAVAGDLPEAEGSMPDFAALQVPGRPITAGTAIFAATKLLMAIARDMTISRTAKHDAESLCWVFVYAVYKMALADQTYGAHSLLEAEFMVPFAIIEIQDVLKQRREAFDRTTKSVVPGIEQLRVYLTHTKRGLLRQCVEFVWLTLFHLQQNIQLEPEVPTTPGPDDLESNFLLAEFVGKPITLLPPSTAPEYGDPTSDLIAVFRRCIQVLKEEKTGLA